jgi:hypothetical protein
MIQATAATITQPIERRTWANFNASLCFLRGRRRRRSRSAPEREGEVDSRGQEGYRYFDIHDLSFSPDRHRTTGDRQISLPHRG